MQQELNSPHYQRDYEKWQLHKGKTDKMSETNKPAYVVACGTSLGGTPDPEYGRRAMGVAAKAELKPIAGGIVGEAVKVLEGELPAGAQFLVVEKFPSMAVLEAFYFSDEYQSAIPFRKDTVRMDFVVAVDGISEAELEQRKQQAAQDSRSGAEGEQ
jgi:uncharacterized protein (DUF1330 family)